MLARSGSGWDSLRNRDDRRRSVSTTQRAGSSIADLASWRNAIGSAFPPLQLSVHGSAAAFRGRVRVQGTPDVVLGDVSAEASHAVIRSAVDIGRERTRLCKISYQLAGRSVLVQNGRRRVLTPGEIAVYDVDAPYAIENDAGFRTLVLMAPRRLLGLDDRQIATAVGLRLSERAGLGRLAGPFLRELAERPDHLGGPCGSRAARTLTDLMAAAVVEKYREAGPDTPLQRIVEWLEAHLQDPDLSPGTIAAANFVSTRRLHELFHDEGTSVSAWVRKRRLGCSRRDLENPRLAGETIAAVARRWRFVDPAHFSRCFRAEFGVSPREHRERHLPVSAGQPR
jgi:AraC-like DNA-binding protein